VNNYIKYDNQVSWGRTLHASHEIAFPKFSSQLENIIKQGSANKNGLLAIGMGRSYGDSCLNDNGAVIDMTALNRLISFDEKTGVLFAQAGISLEDILDFSIPRGFFLPVTPGTRYVTLGGAIANDVHGKNHSNAGTIGNFVNEIGLMRTDGSFHKLTPNKNIGLFKATIGGLGLTGVITYVGLKLKPIKSSLMDAETIKFANLDEFFSLAKESEKNFEYSVAWIDCLAKGESLGRGLFSRANHSINGDLSIEKGLSLPDIPIDAPNFALNRFSIAAFNQVYYAAGGRKKDLSQISCFPFFYPLDFIGKWNKLYGKRGMYQYQSVVPTDVAKDATKEMLEQIAKAAQGSFLVVLKTLGKIPSTGYMSFPFEGTTLALDFPNKGKSTLDLLARLDDIVKEARGRNYPAKDGRISAQMIEAGYPQLKKFEKYIDEGMNSSFWRRIKGK